MKEIVLAEFGFRCPLLICIEILDSEIPPAAFTSAMQQRLLPHLMIFKMLYPQQVLTRAASYLCAISACPLLAQVHVGELCLYLPEEWLALPRQATPLFIHSLPDSLPSGLRLDLRELYVRQNTNTPAAVIATLLRAAPGLQVVALQGGDTGSHHILLGQSTLANLADIKLLHQRIQAGFELRKINLNCAGLVAAAGRQMDAGAAPRERQLATYELLAQMPCFPQFLCCTVVLARGEPSCLGHLSRVVPSLQGLAMSGHWKDDDLFDLMQLENLRSLHMADAPRINTHTRLRCSYRGCQGCHS